ncbi:MAG: hypothetical protein ABIP80_01905, partial [Ferruginibacter sp.]
MKSYKWTQKIIIVMLGYIFMSGNQALAQHATNSLYSQTSEMADGLIQYNADKASIMRFYAAGSENFSRYSYNSPERRKRLLVLIDEYLNMLNKLPFENWNINGKVDYVLFKRNLESEQYQLLEEQRLYGQVAKYITFSDRIYTLEMPRRRGFSVKGEEVAKELNEINKNIVKAIAELKILDSLELNAAKLGSDAALGLQGSLRDYFNFYNGYDPLFTWWVPKTFSETDSLLNAFATAIRKKGKINMLQKDDGSGI